MRNQRPPWSSRGIVLTIAFALCLSVAGLGSAQTQCDLASTIFRYVGQDFVRVQTTLRTESGKSASNSNLSHDSPAYRALIKKRSFSGAVTLFGRKYEAHYAPLTDEGGHLTGAIFVAVPR